jgi:iron(III) transport system ATP-binding protein
LDLKLEEGELFALLGPSGCGKSTILRCVAGLETPDEGEIWIRDTCVFSSERKINIPPDARGVGLVFQSYAVWPHLTVYENVALPLQRGRNRIDKVDVEERVMRALTLVQMESMAQRPAPLLSGGQQQRVALARSLAYEPNLILLDEPLSNLDAKLRAEMRTELRELVKQLGLTGLYVTHDQEEALMMADRIGLMDGGVLRQAGDPQTIYERPADEFTARFVGQANLVEGVVLSELSGADGWLVKTAIGELTCGTTDEISPGQNVTVMFRPNHVVVSGEPGPDGRPNVRR